MYIENLRWKLTSREAVAKGAAELITQVCNNPEFAFLMDEYVKKNKKDFEFRSGTAWGGIYLFSRIRYCAHDPKSVNGRKIMKQICLPRGAHAHATMRVLSSMLGIKMHSL